MSPSKLSENTLKALVFGANDGIITTFAVVAGVAGAHLAPFVVLVMGISNMVSDGISMGLGDFLGERSAIRFRLSHHLARNGTNRQARNTSLATFLSFIIAGTLPLLPYIVDALGLSIGHLFEASIAATTFALFLVGCLRTPFIKGSWWYNGLEMLFVGSLAACAAYFIGSLIGNIVPRTLS